MQIRKDIEEDYKGTRKVLYSMAKNVRNKKNESSEVVNDANGDLLVDLEDIVCRWRNYFDVLLNIRNDFFPMQ